jgi:hypothetical protein
MAQPEIVGIVQLWMPILISAVFVFVMSSLIHMVFGYHRGDYKGLPDEAKALEMLGTMGLVPGITYHFPHCGSQKEMNSPEFQEKMNKGPNGIMTVFPNGMPNMGKYLTCWFLYCVAVGVFVAYVTGRTVPSGAHYLRVFQIAGTVAFLSYAMAHTHNSIWKGEAWSTTFKFYFDGLIYAGLTAGTFGWLWPKG